MNDRSQKKSIHQFSKEKILMAERQIQDRKFIQNS